MRTRATRSTVDRGYTPRQNYNRREESDTMGPRYNSPGRYREYDYNSNRELKENYSSTREYNYRDYNSNREYNPREYQPRDYSRDYQTSKDYNREFPKTRDFENTREYANSSREFHSGNRDYRPNSRDFHASREFPNTREYHDSRDYTSNNREYPASREYPRYDYQQNSRPYPPNSRDVPDYEKTYQDRRYYRERAGPYDRRNLPRQDFRRPETQGFEYEPKAPSGPVRRPRQQTKVHRTKVFIGNLSGDVTQEELTAKFSTFGPINRIDFRRKFAFVDYVRSKDADAAIRQMNNKFMGGSCLKVQPHIEQQKKLSSREPKPSFQITVTNLDQSVSWQDLKDFARQAGDVNYASIIIKGDKRFGLIEFLDDESVKNAMRDLNGKTIVTNKLELIHIPVSEFLKNLGFNDSLVEPTGEETGSSASQAQADLNTENKYSNDTFEAEDNSKSPSSVPEGNQDDLYQEENLDSVDYN